MWAEYVNCTNAVCHDYSVYVWVWVWMWMWVWVAIGGLGIYATIYNNSQRTGPARLKPGNDFKSDPVVLIGCPLLTDANNDGIMKPKYVTPSRLLLLNNHMIIMTLSLIIISWMMGLSLFLKINLECRLQNGGHFCQASSWYTYRVVNRLRIYIHSHIGAVVPSTSSSFQPWSYVPIAIRMRWDNKAILLSNIETGK